MESGRFCKGFRVFKGGWILLMGLDSIKEVSVSVQWFLMLHKRFERFRKGFPGL